MPYLKLDSFSGISPRTGAALLQPNQAQEARNVKLQSGELRPWRKPVKAYSTSVANVETVYKLKKESGEFIWLEWAADVNVVSSPVADVSDYRLYYTGDGPPKKTNWNLATNTGTGIAPYPDAYLELAVPAPTVAPTTVGGGRPLGSISVTNGGTGYAVVPTVTFASGGGSGVAGVATVLNGVVTAVTITNRGTGYTGVPSVGFTGSGGAGATATAVRGELQSIAVTNAGTGGQLASVTITAAGTGFTSAPTLTVSGGGGSGATATATVTDGQITSIAVTPGNGYSSDPVITVSGGGGTDAVLTAVRGAGYTVAPTVVIGGPGTGAVAEAVLEGGLVVGIRVTTRGQGFTSTPGISFSGGAGGSGVTATATADTGVIVAVTITAGGTNYGPTVAFSGGGGTGAIATANVANGVITGITFTMATDGTPNAGTGYTSLPTVTISGGGGASATAVAQFSISESRAYVYTYLSTFGSVVEESAPSPASELLAVTSTQDVVVTQFSPPPAGHYNFTGIRLYRSVVGTAGAAFFLVAEIPLTTGSYTDSVKAVNLGVVLPSTTWSTPPDDLVGLVAMPNGILAGFRKNEVWFSEPFLPHAWPSDYMLTVGYNIVGLGVFGQSLVVCTTQNPYLITGSQPGAMSQEKLPTPEPCVSKKSIASDQYGVLYASPNGLVSIAPGGAEVVTRALFTRDEWQAHATPTSLVGAIYQNMYLGFYQSGNVKEAFVIMRGDTPPLVEISVAAQSVFVERSTATVFVLDPVDYNVYELDADPINNTVFEWKSKKFILPEPTNFAAVKVQADWAYIADDAAYNIAVAAATAANAAVWASGVSLEGALNTVALNVHEMNGSILIPIPSAAEVRNVQVTIYANGVQVFSSGVTSQQVLRLPAAGKEYIWEVLLTGNAPLREFRMATSVGELRQI